VPQPHRSEPGDRARGKRVPVKIDLLSLLLLRAGVNHRRLSECGRVKNYKERRKND
jgi:hypothetical protein